jgi:hypothetical protein
MIVMEQYLQSRFFGFTDQRLLLFIHIMIYLNALK